MAINKKLIHFKKFSDFNSKKLSANEENTKYTVGVGGSVTTGAPDILYQSICWIKDTKQQWTHGELYDCDMDDVKPYVAFFTFYEIQQLADSGESRQCDQEDYMGILDAVKSGRPILISNDYNLGYATVVNKLVDDCIYLTVVGDVAGGAPRFYDVNVWEGEVLAAEITYQQGIPEPYYFEYSASEIISADLHGVQGLVYTEEDYLNLYEAVKQLRPVVIKCGSGYPGGTCLVLNQTCDDAVYLSVALGDPGQVELYELEVWADSVDIYKRSFQDKLVSGTNIKTINGQSLLGSGDITISSGPSSGGSGAYSEIQHGTSDTTFDLTPNTFHVWDEVASLTLSFDVQTIGVANEFLFQFTSGSTATTLSLPDDIKWANDNAPTIEPNKIYQISILNNLASVLEFNNAVDVVLIDFKINGTAYIAEENMTWEEWVNSEYNAANCTILDSYVYKDGAKIGINYVAIHKNDTIINNQTYMLIASGGGGAD